MPNSDKRHATIDLLPIAHITKNPTKPDPVLGAPDAYKRIAPSAFSQIRFQPPSSTVRKFSPLHRPADFPIATHGFKLACPWTCYRKTYRLRFGVDYWLTGAQQVQKPCDEVLVQEFSRTTNKDELQRLQELRHDNIHAVLKAFQQDKTIHVVFEYMELSLHDIAKVGVKTPELAAILGQVVDGLAYLSEQGLEHGSLTCSTTLVSKEGAVKIGDCVRCRPRAAGEGESPNIIALKNITAQLMGGYVNQKDAACLLDLERWPTVAARFLADTTSATLVHQLQFHEFLELSCPPEQLKSVVSRVIRTARISLEDMPPSA